MGWSARQQATPEGSVAAHSRPRHSTLGGGSISPHLVLRRSRLVLAPLCRAAGRAGALPCPACSCPVSRPAGLGPGVPAQPGLGRGAGRPRGGGRRTQPWLELPGPSSESPSREAQSRQSSWFHFGSFSSEIIRASAAGRAGHGDVSAVRDQNRSPLGLVPVPVSSSSPSWGFSLDPQSPLLLQEPQSELSGGVSFLPFCHYSSASFSQENFLENFPAYLKNLWGLLQ